MDQSAVSSLLGQLSGLLVDEAKLLSGVRQDVQFIKDEMESMQGFLLDAADAGNNSNQVMAWRRQVREVAYDSQRCMDHYVQTLGASRPSAGLLGSVGRLPQLVLTMPSRHRIANRIKDLKARAQEVGERRQRYGVKAPTPSSAGAAAGVNVGRAGATALMLSPQQLAAEHARRRRDIAHATDWVNSDAQHVMEWIAAGGDQREAQHHDGSRQKHTFDFRKYLHMPHFTTINLLTELKEVMGKGNRADATAFLVEHATEIFEGKVHKLFSMLAELLASSPKHDGEDKKGAAASSPPEDHHAKEKKPTEDVDPTSETAKQAAVDPSEMAEEKEKDHRLHLPRWLPHKKKPGAVVDPSEIDKEKAKDPKHHLADWLLHKKAAAASTSSEDNDATKKTAAEDPSEMAEASSVDGHNVVSYPPSEDHVANKNKMSKEEAQHHKLRIIGWLRRVVKSDGIHLVHKEKIHGPRILAIVTPPVNQQNLEDGDPHELRRATEIARKVYEDYSRQGSRFDFTVWVDDAEHQSDSCARLKSILQQVQSQAQVLEREEHPQEVQHPSSSRDKGGQKNSTGDDGDVTTKLQQEIRKHLMGRKFLIFLANHQDETPWEQILPALPSDTTDESAIILSPLVQQSYQYIGWYALSLCFLLRHSRYRVYFYSHFVATRNKARELLRAGEHNKGEDLHGLVDQILSCCRWDSFSSKMFLHALYANPRRSKPDLESLLRSLDEFSTASNTRNMIRFCYDDLPYHYKICFQYLSIIVSSSESKISRTSLVRRWAAEGLVVGRDGLAATDEAERCFSALIDRGLLLPADNTDTPSGKVKLCTVDPHVVSFIARLPRVDSREAADGIDLPPSFAHRLSIPCGIQLSKKTRRRASEGLKKQMGSGGKPSAAGGSQDSVSERMIKLLNLFPTSESGWIKVLDLERCRGLKKKHLKNICNKAFQLKYLSLRNTGIAELPKEINKLQDLETFDIRGTNIEYFPAKSVVLPKLAQLLSGPGYIDPTSNNDLTSGGSSHESSMTIHIPRGIGSMTNMQILSHVQVSDGDDQAALDDLARLQVLSKLGVVIHGKQADLLLKVVGMLNECLRSLSVRISDGGEVPDLNKTTSILSSPPRSLTSLSISGMIGGLPTWLQKLEQLSDITLRDTSLKDSDIKILATLVNLRFIRLLRESYNQKKLSFEKGFRNLEFLIIEGSGTISDIHFDQRVAPKLEKIVWISTCKMENLGIDTLEGLKEIELKGECDLNRIRISVQANPCHPNLTHISPTLNSPTLQTGERTAAAIGTSATNK